MTQAELAVSDPAGEPRPVRVPGSVGRALQELRSEMYEPGRGTWFSLRYTVDPPMEYRVLFNYDDDPNWWPPLPAKAWASDLQTYPRNPEYVPGWLTAKLAEWNQQEE
ncbi:hypothetical protein ACFXPS_22170 [Nocardia sp. NPDC059091]|uniref:hypothetical protein n=1 Tax=Nocardia sp. NPDC059091 TaxID=3346724 RepID=UPI003696EDB3